MRRVSVVGGSCRRYHRTFPARLASVPGLRVVRLPSSRAVRR
jgi:hypothetical protein